MYFHNVAARTGLNGGKRPHFNVGGSPNGAPNEHKKAKIYETWPSY